MFYGNVLVCFVFIIIFVIFVVFMVFVFKFFFMGGGVLGVVKVKKEYKQEVKIVFVFLFDMVVVLILFDVFCDKFFVDGGGVDVCRYDDVVV